MSLSDLVPNISRPPPAAYPDASTFAIGHDMAPVEAQLAQGIPLTPQQRSAMLEALAAPGGGFSSVASGAANYANASDKDLWSAFATKIQHSENPPDDRWAKLGLIAASSLVGAGAGTMFGGGTSAMTPTDASTLGAMTEGVPAGATGSGGVTGTTGAAGATGLGGVTGSGSAGGYAMPAAVPESASTLSGWGMTETSPGVWTQAAATGGGTALSRLLNGTATTEDYLELAGRAAPGLLGAYGANQQANAYSDLGNKYLAIGAPSRARFESSFAPGFSMENEPGFKDALALTTKETLHQLSPGGNIAGSPNAWEATLRDVNSKFAYPALNEYRRVNAGAGGLAALTSAAPGAESSAINANKNVYDALGAAGADIFAPPRNLSDLLREFKRAVA